MRSFTFYKKFETLKGHLSDLDNKFYSSSIKDTCGVRYNESKLCLLPLMFWRVVNLSRFLIQYWLSSTIDTENRTYNFADVQLSPKQELGRLVGRNVY